MVEKKYNIPAIILGMSVNGLGVARSLGRQGIKVFALDSTPARQAMSTRYAVCLNCPDARKDPQGLIQFLKALIKDNGSTAVLFPTSDMHNEFVHRYRRELEAFCKFAIPSVELMEKLLSKQGQHELALKYNVPIPRTYTPQNFNQVTDIAQKLHYPAIIKGLNTITWREKFGDQKAIVVKSPDELTAAYKVMFANSSIETIIQEIIEGDDSRHFKICAYYDHEGKALLRFTLQKIRQYPCDFGIGSSVVSVWDREVANLGLMFMSEMGYRGVGSIEFKRDSRDNQLKMIEINPRLWAQNSLADACGQNFPLTVYLDLIGEKLEAKTCFREGVKWIAFKEDRASFLGYKRQGRMTWGQWLKSLLVGEKVWSLWVWDDPMPFLKSIKFGFLPFEKVGNRLGRWMKPSLAR